MRHLTLRAPTLTMYRIYASELRHLIILMCHMDLVKVIISGERKKFMRHLYTSVRIILQSTR